ncbi:MAG: penicillin-binding transpeptidase domain-containing protein [Anaerolineales bacterium]
MNGSPHLHNHIKHWRIYSFIIIFAAIFAIFIGRLFYLQILQGPTYTAQAVENSTKTVNLPAPRGIIYDRNSVILARNVASYNVVMTAADLPDDSGAVQSIFRQLSALIGVPVDGGALTKDNPFVPCVSNHGIQQIYEYGISSTPYDPVRVKCDVDRRTAMIVQEKAVDWPGISIEIQPIRDYPTGELTASIIGFLGPIPANREAQFTAEGLVPNRDKVGYAGLELEFQDVLAGKNGTRVVQKDVAGKQLEPVSPPVQPVPGYNLLLSTELDDWNAYFGKIVFSTGVVIAMNPKTGEVLAMVSYPSYENNRFARFIPEYYYNQLVNDPTNPLLNHAVGDVLPVGSVFKLVTAVGGLNEGVVTPDEIIKTPGKLVITEKYNPNDPGRSKEFVDWIYRTNPAGFGQLDFVHALANSSNVYFYKVGGGFKDEIPNGGLGICRLGTYAHAMGYGPRPGILLPDEQDGLIPTPTWKRITHAESWSIGDTYIASVGQGYDLGTPIQVLLSAVTVANDGKQMQPTLIRDVTDGEGNVVPLYLDAQGNFTTDPTNSVRQISPFLPQARWDLTKDPMIQEYNPITVRGCEPIPNKLKTVQPWVFQKIQEGMRLAVTEGTLSGKSIGFQKLDIAAAGKTGTAEYCDQYAAARNLCAPGDWPAHAWTLSFAPYDNPEIAIVAYVYNGGEGSTVAGPIVRKVMQAYFELKAMDNANKAP